MSVMVCKNFKPLFSPFPSNVMTTFASCMASKITYKFPVENSLMFGSASESLRVTNALL